MSEEVHVSEEGLQLLITLDDPWNARECDAFNSRQAEHAGAYRSGQPIQQAGDTTVEQRTLLVMPPPG